RWLGPPQSRMKMQDFSSRPRLPCPPSSRATRIPGTPRLRRPVPPAWRSRRREIVPGGGVPLAPGGVLMLVPPESRPGGKGAARRPGEFPHRKEGGPGEAKIADARAPVCRKKRERHRAPTATSPTERRGGGNPRRPDQHRHGSLPGGVGGGSGGFLGVHGLPPDLALPHDEAHRPGRPRRLRATETETSGV